MTASHRTALAVWCLRHADGSNQPELAGAFVDRQRQAVGDADEGDDDGQGEQAVHEVDDLVELRRLGVDVLGPALQLGVRVGVADAAIAASASASSTPEACGDVHGEVELVDAGRLVERVADDEWAGEVVVRVDALDGQGAGGAVEERELDRVADAEVPVAGFVVVDQDPVAVRAPAIDPSTMPTSNTSPAVAGSIAT